MIRVVLMGAAGRMGRAVEAAAAGAGDLAIGARVDTRANLPADAGGWSDDLAAVLEPGEDHVVHARR